MYSLIRTEGPPRFLLFPMIHIGSPEYYSQVHKRLEECDILLYEGVRTARARVLALSYRIVARRRRLGLVAQNASLLRGLRGRLVHADIAPGEFNNNWSQVPWHVRLAILLIAPLYGSYRYLTATKESIGKQLKREDLASAEEIMRDECAPALHAAIVASRDVVLVTAIGSIIASANAPATIGIVYGAGHMPAVTAALMEKHHYRIDKSEWLTVFDYAST
jgi:pheromone shutdown protein TraB